MHCLSWIFRCLKALKIPSSSSLDFKFCLTVQVLKSMVILLLNLQLLKEPDFRYITRFRSAFSGEIDIDLYL